MIVACRCPHCSALNVNDFPYESDPPQQKCRQCKNYFFEDEAQDTDTELDFAEFDEDDYEEDD